MNPFLSVCGSESPWRVTVEGATAAPVLRTFDAPAVVVGHDPAADLRLSHPEISERHAYFQLVDGRLFGLDLGSRGGTYWDGDRRKAGWIEPGTALRIGPNVLRFPDLAESGDEAIPPTDDDPALPRWTLDIRLRGVRPMQAQLGGRLVLLGSSTECQLRLLDPSVASHHAALLRTKTGVWVIDLLGPGGIAVNGTRVRYAPLQEGDELLIGRSTLWLKPNATGTVPKTGPPRASMSVGDGSSPAIRPSVPRSGGNGKSAPLDPTRNRTGPTPSGRADEPTQSSPLPRERVAARQPGEGAPSQPRLQPLVPSPGPTDLVLPQERVSRSHQKGSAAAPEGLKEKRVSPESPPCKPAPSRTKEVASPPDGGETKERRGSFRYSVPETRAEIAWWEKAPEVAAREKASDSCTYSMMMARGPGFKNGMTAKRDTTEVRREAASAQQVLVSRNSTIALVDVSQSGLALVGDEAPTAGQRVWFRLEGERTSEWVEIVPVGEARTEQGRHFLRFAFRDSCPYELFKALVFEAKSLRN